MLKEIIFPKLPKKMALSSRPQCPMYSCPSCEKEGKTEALYHEQIPCPDGRRDCMTLHYAYVCCRCGKAFREVERKRKKKSNE